MYVLIVWSYKTIPKDRRCTEAGQNPKLITVMYVRFKVTTCLYLSPSNKARSLSTLIAVNVDKDTDPKCNLRKLLPNLRNSKYPIFRSQMKSNKSLPKVLQWYQHRDQLSLGYDTRVWTADEVKLPCAEQLGPECSPKMQTWKEKYLELKGI